MSSRYEDRHRDSKRDSSSGHRSSSSRREDSRSPPRKPRDEKELPESFGRAQTEEPKEDDNLSVLQQMKSSYLLSPLSCLNKCLDGTRKVKVWTRNYKEVRGICTGYITAYDKHWNLVMQDVEEVYLKPRRAKTPYLLAEDTSMPELPKRLPKEKKDKAAAAAAQEKKEPEKPKETAAEGDGKEKEKKKKKKKNRGPTTCQRVLKQFFVRGDNIVMIAVLDADESEEEEEEEAEVKAEKE